MSSYPPPGGIYQAQQPPHARPESNRTRTNSSTADRYRPRAYSNPPPTQPEPSLLGPYQQPYPPQQQPPYPQQPHYAPAQNPLPMPQPAQSFQPPLSSAVHSRHDSYTRPPPPPLMDDYGRRPSYASQRSRHSYESRHSHDSRHSRDSRRSRHSKHSSYDDSDREERRARRRRKEKQSSHPNRTNERPTMVDSIYSMFGLLKSALGPRDKY